MHIFVDGSYSPQKMLGVGAYIIISSQDLEQFQTLSISELKIRMSNNINYCTFEKSNGSTDIEQKILSLALARLEIDKVLLEKSLTVYTDCQKTKNSDFYNVVHVKGHTKQENRKGHEKIFDVIDKAARKRLRKLILLFN